MAEEAETMAFCTQGFERVDSRKVNKHEEEHEDKHEDELIDSEILNNYVPREEPCGGTIGDYVTRPGVEK